MSRFIKEFSSFASDIDLRAEDPGGRPAERVEIVDAGGGQLNLELEMSYAGRADTTLTALANKDQFTFEQILTLRAGTTIGVVRVYWERSLGR